VRGEVNASPVPAKRSNHLVPGGNRGWLPAILATMLNTAPRTFSIMGLVPSPGGDTKRRPAAEPVMIRMLPTVAWASAVFFFFLFTCEYIVFGQPVQLTVGSEKVHAFWGRAQLVREKSVVL